MDDEIFCVTFSSLAQSCKTYDEYTQRMSDTSTAGLEAVAVALVGPKKKVNKLVGSLPLFRSLPRSAAAPIDATGVDV